MTRSISLIEAIILLHEQKKLKKKKVQSPDQLRATPQNIAKAKKLAKTVLKKRPSKSFL